MCERLQDMGDRFLIMPISLEKKIFLLNKNVITKLGTSCIGIDYITKNINYTPLHLSKY